jgi:hypothetical protein
LAIQLSLTSPVLSALVDTTSQWLGRQQARSVKLTLDGDTLEVPAVGGSFFLLGQTLPIGYGYSGYRAGFWLATAAALAMSIGGVLAVAGAASFAKSS